jgi:hypothetical protein
MTRTRSRGSANGKMKKYLSIVALTSPVIGLAGCSSVPIGDDPSLTTAQRDQAQREARRPPAGPNESYETVIVELDIPIPVDQFSKWFSETGASEFSVFMTGSSALIPIHLIGNVLPTDATRSDALIGSWRNAGDRRRVVFPDGTHALEEITVDQLPQRFQYEVWDVTNDTGRYVAYARSEFRFSERGQRTHISWEYSFRPKGLPDGWFISRFVHEDFRPFMEATLTAMQGRARADLHVE